MVLPLSSLLLVISLFLLLVLYAAGHFTAGYHSGAPRRFTVDCRCAIGHCVVAHSVVYRGFVDAGLSLVPSHSTAADLVAVVVLDVLDVLILANVDPPLLS